MFKKLSQVDEMTRSVVRSPNDERAALAGYRFDPLAAEKVCEFLRQYCTVNVNTFDGPKKVPFAPAPWQRRDLLGPVFGWKRPPREYLQKLSGRPRKEWADVRKWRRRFTSAYWQTGKKNGKTTIDAGLSLYAIVADGEPEALVYIVACNQGQASICYSMASAMVEANPALNARLEDVPYGKRIVDHRTRSVLQALTKGYRGHDGPGPSFVIFDELHRQENDQMYRVMRYASSARSQPLRIEITTAGTSDDVARQSLCFRRYTFSKKVLSGEIEDLRHHVAIYEPSEAEQIELMEGGPALEDPAVWAKANPALGTTLDLDDFKHDMEEAKKDPAQLDDFLQLRLNVWVFSKRRYLPKDEWDHCARVRFDPAELLGRPFLGGLDLSSERDLTAFAALFPWEDDTFRLFVKFWCPRVTARRRELGGDIPYHKWIKEGYVSITHRKAIDLDEIEDFLAKFCSEHVPGMIYSDPWNARQLVNNLEEKHRIPVMAIQQGYAHMTGPVKTLSRLVSEGSLHHNANPVLDWNAENVRVKRRGEQVMLDRENPIGKIDGIAATVNAICAWEDGHTPGPSGSVYDTRGIIVIGGP
jgi:phage terminase large subunit-like protein